MCGLTLSVDISYAPPLHICQLPVAPQVRVGLEAHVPSMLGFCLVQACAVLVHTVTHAVGQCATPVVKTPCSVAVNSGS